jgi:MFS family permease
MTDEARQPADRVGYTPVATPSFDQAVRPEPPPYFRWAALVCLSLAMFGNYYPYDAVAPVADLLASQLGYTDEQIGSLYSIYSVAAVLVLLAGGYIIDRYGAKHSMAAFAAICVVASLVTAASADIRVMLAGRFLLGVGAEPLIVAVTTALAKWFKGKELSFAFGLTMTAARLGSVAADNSPSWARPLFADWQQPLVLAAGITLLCLVGGMAYWMLENRAAREYRLGGQAETEKLVLRDLYQFDRAYWLIVGLCVVFYSAIFPFRAFAIKYFIEAHGASREFAGFLNSVLPLSAMFATPAFGLMADRIGRRASLMVFGSLLLLPSFLFMGYTNISLFVPIAMLGVSFSLIPAVMWPSVAYIVDQRRLGSAYALMTLCQQLGVAAIPWLIGRANDAFGAGPANPHGYIPMIWILTVLTSAGVLCALLLWRVERGPRAHGLETITTASAPGQSA